MITSPPETEFRASAQAPPSKLPKQSPTTEITLATPDIEAASSAPNPPAHSTVGVPPMVTAAPTSWAVTGCNLSPEDSAITVTSIYSPQITFASSRNLLTTTATESAPSNFCPGGFSGGGE